MNVADLIRTVFFAKTQVSVESSSSSSVEGCVWNAVSFNKLEVWTSFLQEIYVTAALILNHEHSIALMMMSVLKSKSGISDLFTRKIESDWI